MKTRTQNRYHRLLLNDAIKDKKSDISHLTKKSADLRHELSNQTTWMRSRLILLSINRLLTHEKNCISKRHKAKIDLLLFLKNTVDGLQSNPNETIINLSRQELTAEQIEILNLGL